MYLKKLLIVFFLALVLLCPSFALAQSEEPTETNDTTYGAGVAAARSGLATTKISRMGSPAAVVGIVINVALSFVGIIFFVLVLYAGFTWMTAMGNTEKVTKAKDIIEAAVIGLVLVAAAYAISSFVVGRFG